MQEIVWRDINMIQPPEKPLEKEYMVTVYNKYWNEPQVMFMRWSVEYVRGFKYHIWKMDNVKIPSSYNVTHWTEKPKPAEIID
jgi:hypothetical protein